MRNVEIFEVGPRDGLQNEKQFIETAAKVALIDCLSQAGFRRIEVASFVSPKWVPQMADSGDVMRRISRRSSVRYSALAPNMIGLERALAAAADEISIFGSASEGFSKANLNCSIEESFQRFAPVVTAARTAGLPVRGYVSCVTDCPFDGTVDPRQVARVVARLRDLGCYEISLGDTIGRGTPESISAMLQCVLQEVRADQIAGHYHDTGGQALANIGASLELGIRVFDAAIGGLGGCPYAPGASGNVATEAVHEWLTGMGWHTGLDRVVIAKAVSMAQAMRNRGHDHV